MTTDWRTIGGGASAWFEVPSLTAGAALIERIADLMDGDDLPALELRASGVRVRISMADVELARAISAAAQELGLTANPAALQIVQLAIDAADKTSVVSFWQTALAYKPVGDGSLVDPLRRDPAISFHRQDQPRPQRNRIHVDVARVPEAVEAVKAALGQAAYGVYQLTLADADGNEIDLVPGSELSKETYDWHALFGAMTFYPTTSPAQAVELTTSVAGLADDAGLPLLVDLRPDGVTIDSGKDQWEDEEGAAEPGFVDLAGRIQTAAYDLGLAADPTRLRFVQFGIDAVDVPAVRAFWTTALGYQHDPRPHASDIYDPRRLNPVIIFQQLDAAEEDRRRQRNRIHLDLLVPSDQVQPRIDAAVAAGGRVVTGTTLTDPEGNELTITTNS
ncbi:VOC family protein [Kribbella catacumbae]|uniref:VOC family protein n=1 Tax=Kribbella catacumbae TaxID=460086 RepID=UPI000382D5A5|nr:VOC family protein [Kribbella catacumbae]